jgi:predicted transcriptional regulator
MTASGRKNMDKGNWTFLSNHGHVFAYIIKNSHCTIQEIAGATELSVAGVQKMINDLEKGGYITKLKVGRVNQYIVHEDAPARRNLDHNIGWLIRGLRDG